MSAANCLDCAFRDSVADCECTCAVTAKALRAEVDTLRKERDFLRRDQAAQEMTVRGLSAEKDALFFEDRHARATIARLREALGKIASGGCRYSTFAGGCSTGPDRHRADDWCGSCLARAALETTPPPAKPKCWNCEGQPKHGCRECNPGFTSKEILHNPAANGVDLLCWCDACRRPSTGESR